MTTLLFLAVVLAAVLTCAYFKVKVPVWTGVIGAVLLAFTLTGQPGWFLLTLSWLVFAAVAVPMNHLPWRREFLTRPVLKAFSGMVPQISETEQVALEAGTVGFEGELFTGRPRWQRLIKKP